jgi:ATP-binding protein involved in chromosome partitioning
LAKTLEKVKHIIAVHSAKGGVGKSTLTVNLAAGLAKRGAKVGMMDADVHGPSGALMMGNAEWPDPGEDENMIHPVTAHGVKFISMGNIVTKKTPLIWRGAMVHSVIAQFLNNVLWGELDYLLVDMPPGTGDAQLSLFQSVSLTGVVVVSTPQELSLADSLRGIKAFEQMKVPLLGLIENMAVFICDDCGDRAYLFGDSGAEMLAEELGMPVLGKVPIEPGITASGDAGEPFVLSAPESASARVVEAAIDRLLQVLEKHKPTRSYDIEWRKMDFLERFPEPPVKDDAQDAPVKAVWQVSGDELGICWPDGEISIFSARELRLACPCAACIEEWSGKPILDPDSVAQDITFKEILSVGRYAINPVFSDNHRSGIFQFARLKGLADKKISS